jgi:hypothetical protein
VLELPLNDQAALTSSRRDIVAGRTVLHPKRTLTNTGASMAVATPTIYAANVKLHTYIYSTPSVLTVNGTTVPRGSGGNGDVTFTVVVNGNLNTIAWSYDSSSGPYCYMKGIEVDYGDGNGYQLLTDGTTNYSNLISGSVESAYPLSNLFGGTIGSNYTNGTRAVNPGTLTLNLAGNKKHYDDNANFNGSASLLLANSGIVLGGDYCIETWFRATGSIAAHTRVFECQPANFAFYIYDGPPRTYVQVGGSSTLNGGNNSFSLDTWHHFATTRQGSVTRLFIDGVQKASGSTTASFDLGTSININGRTQGDYRWNGAMQDFRIYNGAAKYTANFTPPGAILG